MSNELSNIQPNWPRFVRYPLFPTRLEAPHRLSIVVEVVGSVLAFIGFIALGEMLAILFSPSHPRVCAALAGIIPVGFFITHLILRASRLNISESGITFPSIFWIPLKGRLFRPWSDLQIADLHEGKDFGNRVSGNILTLGFKTGGRYDLEITRIPRDDLKILTEALTTFADQKVVNRGITDLVARREFEVCDSTMYVFAKRHRESLSQNFGVTQAPLLPVGALIIGRRFTVQRVLSAGGNRASYLVESAQGENFALHEFNLSMLSASKRAQCLTQLLVEGDRYRSLNVPNLAALKTCHVDGDKFYLALEVHKADTLRRVLKPGRPLPEREVASIALSLAAIVNEMHGLVSPLILGGIRPDSVLYEKSGTVLVAEFGFVYDTIAKYWDRLLLDAPYAAPERLAGDPVPASDLYSIGATMYYALSGFDPSAFTAGQVIAVNKKVSSSMNDLIARLTREDPHERGSVAQLIDELGGVFPALLADSGVA